MNTHTSVHVQACEKNVLRDFTLTIIYDTEIYVNA